LLLSPEKKGQPYRLRYYQVDQAKGRNLGGVPFAEATMVESKAKSSTPWVFAIAGIDPATRKPVIFAGDTEAIHAQLVDAAAPAFSGDSLNFTSGGAPKTLAIASLLGQEAAGHIYAPGAHDSQVSYLQFQPNGDAITVTAAGQVERGRWLTDGSSFHVTPAQGAETVWRLSELQTVTGVPADSRLIVRLLQPLSSLTAKEGMAVSAVLISPGVYSGAILLPQGSEFDGKIVAAHGVKWGIRHETAALTVAFDSVKLPDGRTLPVDARIFRVENSRESVTKDGKIQGIRSTGTLGHSAENQITAVAQIDPIAYLFTASSGAAVLGFAEPEILYNAGTELEIEFNKPVLTTQTYPPGVPKMELSASQASQFQTIVKQLPFRTKTEGSNKPSDITNLIFIGQPEALERAFAAAGWTQADTLTAASTFRTVKTLSGNDSYSQAPMSMLLLGDDKPIFTLQKTTNTFSSRHHVR
jgi:hypothetical protein